MSNWKSVIAAVSIFAFFVAANPAKQSPMEELRSEVQALSKTVAEQSVEIESLKSDVASLKPLLPKQANADKIKAALAKGDVVVGMTAAQLEQCFKKSGIKFMVSQTNERMVDGKEEVTETWRVGQYAEGYSRIVLVNGTVVEVQN